MFLKKPPQFVPTARNAQVVRELYESAAELRRVGITGFVLVELTVGRDGAVEAANAVMPRGLENATAISIDQSTGEVLPPLPPHTLHPDLCRIAERAARNLEFRPASFLGIPVPYRGYRHGFSFDAEVAADQ